MKTRAIRIRCSWTCAVIPVLAMFISGLAIYRWCAQDPWKRGYDFSTPEKAIISTYEIIALPFGWERLDQELREPFFREYLSSLEIRKEVEYRGRRVLFISYSSNGVKMYDSKTMEQHAKTGRWFESDRGLEDPPRELLEQQERWRTKGEL